MVNPTAAGTLRDQEQGTDLIREVRFFGSRAYAYQFFTLAIAPMADSLPRSLRYLDFGGGPGVLSAQVRDGLRARGHAVEAMVADANPRYLAQARARGLGTELCNLESARFAPADLISMRLVNHYNDRPRQRAILASAWQALAPGGYFVSQIEAGHPQCCRLRSDLANLLSRSTGSDARYDWPDLDDYHAMLRDAGFGNAVTVANLSAQLRLDCLLSLAWRRFHGLATARARGADRQAAYAALQARRQAFFQVAKEMLGNLHAGHPEVRTDITADAGGFLVTSRYPIVVTRK